MRRVTGVVLALALAAPAAQSDEATDALVRDVSRARRGVRSIDATFEQAKEMALFRETVHASGRLRVVGGERLRWDMVAPERTSFLFDRGTVAFKGPDGRVEALSGTGLFGAVLGDLAAFLAGDLGTLRGRYRLETEAGADGVATLVARPALSDVRRHVREIRIEFARDRRILRSLVLVEPSFDRSTIRFTRFVPGARVEPEAFRL